VLSNNDNNGLSRSDGKRPDGLTLVPWKEGKPLTWDSTVVCTVADSYVSGSAREAGTAAKPAAQRKEAKYATLQGTHLFQPVVVQSLGNGEEWTSSFWPSWVIESRLCLEIVVRLAFCFNAFLFSCSDLTVLLRESFSADSRPEDDL